MDNIHHDGNNHRDNGVLHTRKPAVQRKEQDSRRYSPYSGVEILGYLLAAIHNLNGSLANGALQDEHQQTHHQSHHNRASQHKGSGAVVASTECLRRDAACTHTDEGTVPVDEVEDGHTDSQRANTAHRLAHMSRYHRAHNAHNRHRDVGDDVGDGYA